MRILLAVDKHKGSASGVPDIHILHAHDHVVVVVEECAVKGDDIVGVAAVHDLELANDALAHLSLRFNVYDLLLG